MKRFLQFLTIVAILNVGFPASTALAQQAGQWSTPIDLSNSLTWSQYPAITTDPSGGVHVVWLESLPGATQAIFYTSLKNGNWTNPIDIVSNVTNSAGPRLVSDEKGTLHLVYYNTNGIAYSQAFAPQADSPRAWSAPVVLVPAKYYQSTLDLAVGSGSAAGMVCLTYAQQIGPSSGIFVVCSHDSGQTWDQPYTVYENMTANQAVDKPRLAIGPDGSLHIVWVLEHFPDTYPAMGLFYSKSTDGGLTWSSEFALADGPYDDPKIGLCAASQVHVVWSGTLTDRYKFHRWSADNGKTWSEPWRNKDLGGLQGRPDLACDSSGRLHWLVIGTIFGFQPKPGTSPDELYYSVFDQGKWSTGELLLLSSTNLEAMNDTQAAIGLGNQLNVVVANPLPLTKTTYQFDIFYTSLTLDSPALPPKNLESPSPTMTPELFIEKVKPTSSPTALAGQLATADTTPWQSVGMGALAAVAVIILVLIIRSFQTRQ